MTRGDISKSDFGTKRSEKWKPKFDVGDSSSKLADELAKLREQGKEEQKQEKEELEEKKVITTKHLNRAKTFISSLRSKGNITDEIAEKIAKIELMHDNITFFMNSPESKAFFRNNCIKKESYIKASEDLAMEAGKVRFIVDGFGPHVPVLAKSLNDIIDKLDNATNAKEIEEKDFGFFLVQSSKIAIGADSIKNLGKEVGITVPKNVSDAVDKYIKDNIDVKEFLRKISRARARIETQFRNASNSRNLAK